jgi:hypothetical protein
VIAGFFALIVTVFIARSPADSWTAGRWVVVALGTVVLYSFIKSTIRRA